VQKADGLLSMLEDASKSDETRKFKRKKRKKLVKSTNNTVSVLQGKEERGQEHMRGSSGASWEVVSTGLAL
jgi:hypothetical protein